MVSVIMAAYNAGEFIARALDSVFSQTFDGFEVVVVDDASTDATLQVLEKYKEERLTVLRNTTRSGAAFSRNRAIEASKGKYIAILDADDFWAPGKLQAQVDFMENNKRASGVGTYVYETDREGVPVKMLRFPLKPEQIKCSTFFRCSFVHSSMLLRRSFLVDKNLKYRDEYKGAHDFELWSRAVFCGSFHQLPEPLTYYRRSPDQISAAHRPMQENYAVKIYKVLLQRIGFVPSEKQLQSHLQLVGMGSGELPAGDVLRWCVKLHEKNALVQLFVPRLFAGEILLRFLKYCRDNSIGIFRTAGLQFWLHVRMGTAVFPYFQLFSRRSKKIKRV